MTQKSPENAFVYEIPLEMLDASNSAQLKKSLLPLIEAHKNLIVDLKRLQFVDSSGLGVFLSCLRTAKANDGELKLCGLTKPVRVLFELVRMYRVFDIYNDSEEAIRSFASSETGA